MAIAARLVGRLGGGHVDVTPVSGSQTGTSWKTLHTVTIPAGETWLIVAAGSVSISNTSLDFELRLGGVTIRPNTKDPGGQFAIAATATTTTALEIRTSSIIAQATFDGTVYAAPLG